VDNRRRSVEVLIKYQTECIYRRYIIIQHSGIHAREIHSVEYLVPFIVADDYAGMVWSLSMVRLQNDNRWYFGLLQQCINQPFYLTGNKDILLEVELELLVLVVFPIYTFNRPTFGIEHIR